MIGHRRFAVAATAALAPLVMAALPAGAATSQTEDAAMTKLAVNVLSNAAAARAALAAKHPGAQRDIQSALAADGTLAAKARADGLTTIVPIYAELDDTAVLSAAVKRKATASAPQTVRANTADLTYLAIDLDAASSHLRAAQTAIRNNNDLAARDSLAAVGNDLVEESIVTDLPLLTAREDLSRAQRELKANDRAAATADLHQASRSLAAYTASDHEHDAQLLAAQIDTDVAAGAMRSPTFSDRVDRWWTSVKNWFAQRS